MIRHIVLFSAIDDASIEAIIETLKGYGDIPGVRELKVSRNLKRDSLSAEFDVILSALFESHTELEAYKRHPIYEAGTRTIRPIRDQRVVVDYEE